MKAWCLQLSICAGGIGSTHHPQTFAGLATYPACCYNGSNGGSQFASQIRQLHVLASRSFTRDEHSVAVDVTMLSCAWCEVMAH